MDGRKNKTMIIEKPNESTEAAYEEAMQCLLAPREIFADYPTMEAKLQKWNLRRQMENRLDRWLERLATNDPAVIFPPR